MDIIIISPSQLQSKREQIDNYQEVSYEPSRLQQQNSHLAKMIIKRQIKYKMLPKAKIQHPTINNITDYDPQRKIVAVPLSFQFLPIEILSKQFTKLNNQHSYRIHYLGARPHNTIAFHKKFAFSQKSQLEIGALARDEKYQRYSVDMRRIIQSHLMQERLRGNSYYKSGLFYRAFQGMNPYLGDNEWIFNSLFEGGNLDCVIKIKQSQFDLFLHVDANTKGHVQWFYFSVKNGTRKQKLKMNICNLSRGKSLYNSGMQPYVYSKQANLKNGTTWQQSGINLGISHKQLRYSYIEDKVPGHLLNYYSLELEYTFQHENDEVFFAYCIPFTFSRLLNQISLLPQQWVKQGVLGKSLSGIDIPLLHITNHSNEKEKKNVLITGRWHPGESNSSHMLQGFLNFLTSTSREAAELRNRMNFFVVPMANPDGVICGNSRTSMAGKDLNRQFIQASKQLYPEVSLVKELAKKLQNSFGLFMYLDFHGHSRKKNTFFYGPSYSIHEPNYYKSRILPKLVEKVDSNFRFHSCSFTIDEQKKHTARAVMFECIKVPFAFTIQTSIGSYYNCEAMKTVLFNEHEWRTIGTSIAQGLSKFVVGFEQYENLMRERRFSRQKKRPPTAGKHAFTEQNNEEEDISSYFKRGQPLKLIYAQKSLFGSVIDELKSTKANQNFMKEIDEEYDSDAHDETQEFQLSKMKEFNNLVTDAAKRDQPKPNKKANQLLPVEPHRAPDRILLQQEEMAEQLKFLEELEQMKKAPDIKSAKESQNKPSIPQFNKTTSEWRKAYENNRISNLTELNRRPGTHNIDKGMGRRSLEKKIVSESQFANEKLSYFGEFRIFADQGKPQDKHKHFSRNSIFNRDKSKSTKKPLEQDRFKSQSLLEKANRSAYIDPYKPPQSYQSPLPPKSTNFEFKFDEIQTTMVTKQKLKDYLRIKAHRSTKNSTIGPASFYGVRQNINQKKITNKQRFLSKDESPRKDSIKVIKFV